jgi:hypothetical protein
VLLVNIGQASVFSIDICRRQHAHVRTGTPVRACKTLRRMNVLHHSYSFSSLRISQLILESFCRRSQISL